VALPRLDNADFARLRGQSAVRRRLRWITPDHYRAFGCYLLTLPVSLILAVYGGYALDQIGLYPGRWLLFVLLGLAAAVPLLPFFYVRAHARRPVLDALAEDNGMDYASDGFQIETLDSALSMLFGADATAELSDLLADAGRESAVCHAEIASRSGGSAFSGLVYTFSRSSESGVSLVLLPPGAECDDIELPVTMTPVDAGVAGWLAWANRPHDAKALLVGLAGQEAFYLYLDRTHALVAGGGPASFDPPASARTPEARLRAIFDNAAAALNRLWALRNRLD
jgi:hypothetical protein